MRRAKQRDLGADRLLILVEDTRINRRALAALGADERGSFPISQRATLAALAAGVDPGGDSIIVLRRLRRTDPPAVAHHETKAERSAVPSPPVSPGATHSA